MLSSVIMATVLLVGGAMSWDSKAWRRSLKTAVLTEESDSWNTDSWVREQDTDNAYQGQPPSHPVQHTPLPGKMQLPAAVSSMPGPAGTAHRPDQGSLDLVGSLMWWLPSLIGISDTGNTCHVMPGDVTWCHVMSCDVMWCHLSVCA